MSQYAAPGRGRAALLAAACVVLLGAGFVAGFFVGRPADGPPARVNAVQACAVLDRWHLPDDGKDAGIEGLNEGHAAYGLARAAARDDPAYDLLAERLTEVLKSVTTLNLDDLPGQVDAARAECAALGL